MAIGVDIEDIKRFEDMGQNLLDRIFTPKEQEYCLQSKNYAPHFAARFCAKEAAFKALCSLGINQPNFRKFEVLNDENGVPTLYLHDLDGYKAEISLSHEHDKAIAFVVVNKEV
jgi:phosphopantetheine--protein transferase-like protein